MKEIARTIGKSEAYVYYMLKLTSMSDDARVIAEKGWIGKGVAWQIAKLESKDQQTEAANALARPNRDKLRHGERSQTLHRTISATVQRRCRKRASGTSATTITRPTGNIILVRFSCEQFEQFKKIVRGRTETDVSQRPSTLRHARNA
jgi:hypothetical protein